jgi:hypothetical protein
MYNPFDLVNPGVWEVSFDAMILLSTQRNGFKECFEIPT